MKTYQLRSEKTGMHYFDTLQGAFQYAREDRSVWKISFNASNGERIRLINNELGDFLLEPMEIS
jgi:myo-inositol-hexaphosphate 3-phosphohydrolase